MKKILRPNYKAYLTESRINGLYESSMNRLHSWMITHDCAMLTAFRKELRNVVDETRTLMTFPGTDTLVEPGYEFSYKENQERNRDLRKALVSAGYGYTKVLGSYMEEGQERPDTEETFFIVNLHNDPDFKDNIVKLSEYYNQDAVLYKPKGECAMLIGTNDADWPGYMQAKFVGNLHFLASAVMTRIKNAGFSFATSDSVKFVKNHEELARMTPEEKGDYTWLYNFNQNDFKYRKSLRESAEDWTTIVRAGGVDLVKSVPDSWVGSLAKRTRK